MLYVVLIARVYNVIKKTKGLIEPKQKIYLYVIILHVCFCKIMCISENSQRKLTAKKE